MKRNKGKYTVLIIASGAILVLMLAVWLIFSINSTVADPQSPKQKELTVNYEQLIGGSCNYFSPYPNRDLCVDDQDIDKLKAEHPEWAKQVRSINDASDNTTPVIVISATTHTESQRRSNAANPPQSRQVSVTRIDAVQSVRLDSVPN